MSDSNDVVAGSGDVDINGKLEHVRDGTPSSMDSSPEPDASTTQEPTQPLKRKGGRKPIYATSEERKQRNRQAQAAFRERRTEYIKQLEATIKQNEESLATLQQSHRSAADECLMLRYKNSLLERILLERGIDVQAELQMKTGSPAFPSGFMQPTGIPQAPGPPLQRTALQRQHARRSAQALTPKPPNGPMQVSTSPHAGPTPTSHISSPSTVSTRSPVAIAGGTTSPSSAIHVQPQGQPSQHFVRSQQPLPNHSFMPPHQTQQPLQRSITSSTAYQSSGSGVSSQSPNGHVAPHNTGRPGSASGIAAASAYYPSPFQTHIDKLEQEYDTQDASHSMLDETDNDQDHPNGRVHLRQHSLTGSFPQQHPYNTTSAHDFGFQHNQASAMPPPGQQRTPLSQYELQQGHQALNTMSGGGDGGAFGTIPQMIDPNDPMLDADPFGLSASMHYPTSYSFDPSGR